MAAVRTSEGRESNGFSYFMIRVHHEAGEGAGRAEVAGVVERLGTGEKRAFASGQELVDLVGGWPPAQAPAAADFDNDAATAAE